RGPGAGAPRSSSTSYSAVPGTSRQGSVMRGVTRRAYPTAHEPGADQASAVASTDFVAGAFFFAAGFFAAGFFATGPSPPSVAGLFRRAFFAAGFFAAGFFATGTSLPSVAGFFAGAFFAAGFFAAGFFAGAFFAAGFFAGAFFAAGFFAAGLPSSAVSPLPLRGSRGGNSKPCLPVGLRKSAPRNGRPRFEMKPSRISVLPVSEKNASASSGDISRRHTALGRMGPLFVVPSRIRRLT